MARVRHYGLLSVMWFGYGVGLSLAYHREVPQAVACWSIATVCAVMA